MSRLSIFFSLLLINSLSAFQPFPITSHPVVGYKEISFFDEPSQQSRKILIWYPIEPGIKGIPSSNLWDVFDIAVDAPVSNPQSKKPLIIVSHGYGGSPNQLSWLINKLVRNNYIVLGLQHLDELNGKWQINHWKRAQDIQMLLDRFSSHPFAKSADLNRIGMAGFSVGGTTAIWLAGGKSTRLDKFAPTSNDASPEEFRGIDEIIETLDKEKMSRDWKDKRIKAVFLMAPGWGWIFSQKDLQTISIPTYIVASKADQVLMTRNNADFFCKNIPHSICQTISGEAGHYIFISEPIEKNKLPPNLSFLIQENSNVNRKWIQYEVAENAINFFDSTIARP